MKIFGNTNLKLSDIVEYVKRYVGDVPFFIAGGSIVDIKAGREINDIDVYFYSAEDYIKAEQRVYNPPNYLRSKCSNFIKYVTPNAITLHNDVQLIRREFGTPQEIFDNFDFTCCCLAIDSDGKFHVSNNFTEHLEINKVNLYSNTMNRYFKYRQYKKIDDPQNKTLKDLINLIVKNRNEELQTYYSYEVNKPNVIHLLKNNDILRSKNYVEYMNYIITNIVESEDERLNIYDYLTNGTYGCKPFSIEHQLFHIIYNPYTDNKKEYAEEEILEIKLKYPEYFI